jgi:chemotaxis protein MotB
MNGTGLAMVGHLFNPGIELGSGLGRFGNKKVLLGRHSNNLDNSPVTTGKGAKVNLPYKTNDRSVGGTAIFFCSTLFANKLKGITLILGYPKTLPGFYLCKKLPPIMSFRFLVLVAGALLSMSACVSSKKFKTSQQDYAKLQDRYKTLETENNACGEEKGILLRQKETLEREKALLTARIKELQEQIAYLKDNNNQALKQLESLSVISTQQAESIKKSMDNLGIKDAYIQNIQRQLSYKDSLNMALVINLKGAIGNLEDGDINIKVDKGVVYVDISDKLLFKTGSYDVTDRANEVLGKVAMVLKNQPDLEFMVEGHTDGVAFKGSGVIADNWDLSAMRATTVVRLLQTKYGLDPARMVAAGRGEYRPIADNSTKEGRSANRRTRIVVLPQLDQFFKLLEKQ